MTMADKVAGFGSSALESCTTTRSHPSWLVAAANIIHSPDVYKAEGQKINRPVGSCQGSFEARFSAPAVKRFSIYVPR